MDVTTLVAGIAVGVALALGGPGLWRWRVRHDLVALLRSLFALLVAVVAVSAAVAVVAADPAVQLAAARVRGSTVLLGIPVLLHLLGAGVDRRPPWWLQGTAIAAAVVGIPVIWATDLYVTGAILPVGTPEPGPAFVALSAPPVALTVVWTAIVCAVTTRSFDRVLLAVGIGVPSLASVLLLLDPAGRDALWVPALTPLLIVVEVTRWRAARDDRATAQSVLQARADLAEQLAETNANLRSALQTRSRLLDAVGHELRTPITVVLGFIEILQQRPDLPSPARAEYLALVERNTRRLHDALEQMVTASVTGDPDRPARREVVDIRAAVQAAVDRAAVPSRAAIDLEPLGDHVVTVDLHDLDVMLDALLDNALVHGHPPVRVTARRADERSLELRISDEGPGVPDELAPHVFEPFVQATSGDQRKTGGVGLGLYNAAQLARRNDGELLLAEDCPASFLLRLPSSTASSPAPRELRSAH